MSAEFKESDWPEKLPDKYCPHYDKLMKLTMEIVEVLRGVDRDWQERFAALAIGLAARELDPDLNVGASEWVRCIRRARLDLAQAKKILEVR